MDSINEKFIQKYDFKTLQLSEIRLEKFDYKFKILKIMNCPTFKEIEYFIERNDFSSVIKQSSYLFFIYIELTKTKCVLDQIEWSSLQLLTEKERPLIIQLDSICEQKNFIIYKNEKEEKLKMLNLDNVPISFEEMKKKIEANETCKFKLLLEAMSSNLCGEFNGNLLESKLNTSDKKRTGFITNELSKRSSFCIRFLQLYKSKMNWSKKRIKTYLQSGVDKFLAYCDLPFNINDEQGISAKKRNKISNHKKLYIMKYSVEIDNSEAVKYLATNFKFDLEAMCSIAVDKKRFNSYRELIVAGSKYPLSVINNNNFNPGDCEKLQAIIDQKEEFHDNIASGSIDKVKDFVQKTPNLKTVFNTKNKSALTTALESSQFDAFTFLQSKGFSKEGDDFYPAVWNKLSDEDKEIIAKSLREYFGTFEETYLVELLSKTQLSQLSLSSTEGENDYFENIRNVYDKLNSHPEIQPILRSIAYSKNLKIVFHLNESFDQDLVPNLSKDEPGLTLPEDGYIFVAGYTDHVNELMGTLAHEMTHYAMHLIYKNNCKPYSVHVKDNDSKTWFKEVLDKTQDFYDRNKELTDPIIKRVFSYPWQKWEAELIVRVPQLIARYKTEHAADNYKLNNIKSDFSELFRYYSDKVLEDSEDHQRKAKEQMKIREINQMCPLLKLIQYEKLHFKKTLKLELSQQDEFNVILTNVPIMTLVTVYQTFEEKEENCLFLNIESLVINENLKTKAKKIFESDIKFMVVIDCTNKLMVYNDALRDFLKLLIDCKNKVILVVKPEDEDSFLTGFSKTINRHHFIHTWEEVRSETLLGKEVFFQSSLVKLSQLCEINSKAIHDLPLKELFEGKTIKINKQQLLDCPNFIDRKFKVLKEYSDNATETDKILNQTQPSRSNNQLSQNKQNQKLKSRETPNAKMDPDKFVYVKKSLKEMIAYGNEKKIVILSDKAGTGKSSVMIEMSRVLNKEENSTTWVSFIDLKEHVASFASMTCVDIEFNQFMDLTVFKEKNTFDRKLFQEFYQQGRTILLLDGFDGISPNYKEIWVKVLKTFNSQAGNRLWITTRSHLEECLETCLSQSSCELLPLSEREQIEYLTTSGPNENESRDAAKSLIKEFKLLAKNKDETENSVIEAPLILSTLAKIYKDQINSSNVSEPKSLNLFSTYIAFVKGFFGVLAKEELLEMLHSRTSHWDVHEKLALKHLCDYERLELEIEYDESEWNAEKLSRLGIFSEKNGKGIFHHETFAEFYVAHYIFGNLKKFHGSKASSLSSSKEKCKKLLTEVVQSEDKRVVRIFLDQAIEQHNKEIFNSQNQVKDFSQIVEKQVRETESYGILVNLASDSCENLMRVFSNGVECFEDDLKRII